MEGILGRVGRGKESLANIHKTFGGWQKHAISSWLLLLISCLNFPQSSPCLLEVQHPSSLSHVSVLLELFPSSPTRLHARLPRCQNHVAGSHGLPPGRNILSATQGAACQHHHCTRAVTKQPCRKAASSLASRHFGSSA